VAGFDDIAHHELVQRVQHNVVKVGWTIFFNPGSGIRIGGRGHFGLTNH
jgi:hypothetical protein